MPKKNVAVIGCGYWGKNLVRNFHELNSLYAVCDPNAVVADLYAKKYDVKNISFEDLLVDPNIEGVVIASPVEHHASLSLKVIKAKKHVFIEKPLASNISDGEEIIKIAKQNNVSVMVGHLLHYHPAFIKVVELIKINKLGKVNYISSTRKSFGKIRKFEDVVWSFAPHDISMILKLAKKFPTSIKSSTSSFIQDDIADVASIYLDFEDNLSAEINLSWIHPEKQHKLIVIGNRGMLIFNDTKEWKEKLSFFEYEVVDKNESIENIKKDVKFIEIQNEEPLKRECIHFLEVLRGQSPNTDGKEGLDVIKVISQVSSEANFKN